MDNKKYTFRGREISRDQRDNLKDIIFLGKSKLLGTRDAQGMLAETLLSRPKVSNLANLLNPQPTQRVNSRTNTRQPNIGNLKIDTNVTDRSLGGFAKNVGNVANTAVQDVKNIATNTTGNSARDAFRNRDPFTFYGNTLLSGLGFKPSTDFLDQLGKGGQQVVADNYAGDQYKRNTTLQGQQALDYINANKSAGFNVLNDAGTGLQNRQTGSYGIVDDIAGGILNSTIGDTIVQGAERGNDLGGGRTNRFMSDQQFQDYRADPNGAMLKNVANYASFAVPFGGSTLAGIGTRFAGAGALSGYGNSQLGNEFQDTIGGAMTGLATGSVLKGVGKVGNLIKNSGAGKAIGTRLSNAGKALQGRGLTSKIGKNPTALADADELQNRAVEIITGVGKTPNARGNGEAYKLISTKFGKVANSSKALGSKSNILSDTLERISLEADVSSPIVTANINRFTNKLSALGDQPPVSKLTKLYKEVQGEMSPIYKALDAGNPLTPKQYVTLSFHDSLGSHIKTIEPKLATIYDDLTVLHRIAEGSNKLKSPSITLPFTNLEVGLPIPAAERAVGRGLQGAGDLMQRGVGNIGNIPFTNIATRGAIASQAIPERQEFSNPMMESTDNSFDTLQSNPQADLQARRTEIFMAAINDGYSPAEAKAFVDMYAPENTNGKQLTESQGKFANAANVAQGALDLLNSGGVGTGPLQPTLTGVQNLFGTTSAAQSDYEAQLAGATGLAINALAGANVPPSEYERIANLIPTTFDQPEQAKQKLQSFINVMKQYSTPQYIGQ